MKALKLIRTISSHLKYSEDNIEDLLDIDGCYYDAGDFIYYDEAIVELEELENRSCLSCVHF